jgi:hypothetical protein
VRNAFRLLPPFRSEHREAWIGLQTNDDFQWLRLWWENDGESGDLFALIPHPKGGIYSNYYADVSLAVRWGKDGRLIKTWKTDQLRQGKITANNSKCWNERHYFRRGLTWPLRTTSLSVRIMPENCVFGQKGPAAFVSSDQEESLLALCAVMNSAPFNYLVSTQLARTELSRSFEVGLIEQTPVPDLNAKQCAIIGALARRSWSLMRTLDTAEETSHAFLLPTALRSRLDDYDRHAIADDLARIQSEIDLMAFDLYGFSDADRTAASKSPAELPETSVEQRKAGDNEAEEEDGDNADPVDQTAGLLSWTVGVAFGRFDWRLATGERTAPAEPEPFDPLLAKSPGMLPDAAKPFHHHGGILVDDPGHPHDLARLVEEVLIRVDAPVPPDVRRWLQRDFFPFHLQCYSKSRRRAPIYLPLATGSGSYTLWLYYPTLSSETLYTAINDFVEPKLKQVGQAGAVLRYKQAARSREEDRRLEALETLQGELIDLRETLLRIAPAYRPNHDDGVQITAAPLWPLFRHKPWQKVLKDTWAKLEEGDYDWAHLAMAYWPDRVRDKCDADKSLAIAHNLEHLYVEPEPKPSEVRTRKRGGNK